MANERHEQQLEAWARQGNEGAKPVRAATVILLRDTGHGPETLMLRRNSKIAFGGMWVFPGGRVDPADCAGLDAADELGAARRAAVREAEEEAGMALSHETLLPLSHWTPPPITPRRYLTWFFVARAPNREVTIDHGEIREHAWLHVDEVMRRREAREIELAPPTWVSLHAIAAHGSVDEVLDAVGAREPERFVTRIHVAHSGPVALWHGDAGYAHAEPEQPGGRHRLIMGKDRWTYLRHD